MSLLLSPAGSPEALTAAIAAGADEVYLGGNRFNARAGARNFDAGQLVSAGQKCRDANVRLLITLNTLTADREFEDVLNYVNFLQTEVGPSAYIVQDLGLAVKLKERFPEAVLHASTQLRQHSSGGAALLKQLGFSRIVLARECSREDIRSFIEHAGVDVEVFVHGALCVCESGGCLMSSMIGRRSGNRGECAQPCRLPYRAKNAYPLSLKDNCLANYVNELSDLGVAALKIEGRMKAPDYVYTVTALYRRLLDEKRVPTEKELRDLQNAFSRTGFTAGYYENKVSPAMFGIRREEDKQNTEKHSQTIRANASPRPKLPAESALPLTLPEADPTRVISPKTQLGYVARFEGEIPDLSAFSDAARIDLPLWKFGKANVAGLEEKVSVILPRVVFDREEADVARLLKAAYDKGVRRATVPNLSLLHLVEKFFLHGDYPLNVYNKETLALLSRLSFSSLFLSPEIDPAAFGFSTVALEGLGYGRVPLMHTETCIIRNVTGVCQQKGDCKTVLTDRTGAEFPVLRGYGHRNLLYNSVPTYRLDKKKDLKKKGVGLLTLLFTVESPAEMEKIVGAHRNAEAPTGNFTRR